jgi:hypothetical protein
LNITDLRKKRGRFEYFSHVKREEALVLGLEWGGSVSARDWQRKRNHIQVGQAQAELDELAALGLGGWTRKKPGSKGGRPTEIFVAHPRGGRTDGAIDPPHVG